MLNFKAFLLAGILFLSLSTALAQTPTVSVTTEPADLFMLPAAGGTVTVQITLSGGATEWVLMDLGGSLYYLRHLLLGAVRETARLPLPIEKTQQLLSVVKL